MAKILSVPFLGHGIVAIAHSIPIYMMYRYSYYQDEHIDSIAVISRPTC